MNGSNAPVEFSLNPEEKIAARLHKILKLSLPIDINSLADKYAIVEFDELPIEADALLLYKTKKSNTPTIILNSNQSETRIRFTLAHELGHIIIPWHVGELAYSSDRDSRPIDGFFYKAMEAEANRFAGELLMPTDWLRSLIHENEQKIQSIIDRIQSGAKVSFHAACIGAIRVSKPETILIEVARDNIIRSCAASPNTQTPSPKRGSEYDAKWFSDLDAEITKLNGTGSTFYWVTPSPKPIHMPKATHGESSGTILNRILDRQNPSAQQRMRMSINGVVGAAVAQLKGSSEQIIYRRLLERFLGRENDLPAIKDVEFKLFLSARATELSNRN